MRSDHRHLTACQIGCQFGQSIILVLRPAILDRHILAVDVPDFAEALPERRHETSSIGRRRAAEEPNNGHRRLRTGHERPRRRAADERDELAPPDAKCHLIPPAGRATEG
jgi:hypothetical protein